MSIDKIEILKDVYIYKSVYTGNTTKDTFISKINLNKRIAGITSDNTSLILLNCLEFDEIRNLTATITSKLSNTANNWIGKMWSYHQTKWNKKNTEYFHNHLFATHSPYSAEYLPILNDWTFCMYIQLSDNNIGNEGTISFKDNGNINTFKPTEGDIIIFPSTLLHMPNLNPNTNCERIVLCGNISYQTNFETKNIL
jgi:hypothetical protein